MGIVWFNRAISDEERRRKLQAGDIFVYDNVRHVGKFAAFAREMVKAALAPHDPLHVHEALAPTELAPVLGRLKPAFTHHPDARRLVRKILEELGIDRDDCHLDVPRLRTCYPSGHLTKGIAYAFPAHRDTWYGAPQAQINWWMPIFPLNGDNDMAFYPRCFAQPTANDSERFDYYRRNVERRDVTKFITEDPRVQPAATGLSPDEPSFRLLPPVGGIVLFSGAQMHATVAGVDCLARYSVDFRTVCRSDVERGRGAPNLDARCTGTALRDFRRVRDAAPMPEAVVRLLDPVGPTAGGMAVFTPGEVGRDGATARTTWTNEVPARFSRSAASP